MHIYIYVPITYKTLCNIGIWHGFSRFFFWWEPACIVASDGSCARSSLSTARLCLSSAYTCTCRPVCVSPGSGCQRHFNSDASGHDRPPVRMGTSRTRNPFSTPSYHSLCIRNPNTHKRSLICDNTIRQSSVFLLRNLHIYIYIYQVPYHIMVTSSCLHAIWPWYDRNLHFTLHFLCHVILQYGNPETLRGHKNYQYCGARLLVE